ncbi:MAG: hypothetical protein IKD10_01800 [Lentisphaeria bacterium]|nr:hypothetical protein [Lentisphaeria bacterium]
MKNRYVKLLLATAACSSFVLAAAEKAESINSTVDSFSVDKQKEEATAKSFVLKGNELFFAAQYLDAAKNYTQAAYIYDALKTNSEYFTAQYNKTRELIAKCYYYLAQETAIQAQEQASASEFDKAIALCENAIKIYPASEKEMQQRIEDYKKMRTAAVKRSALNEANVLPKQSEKEYSIRIKLKQAKLLYYTGQYELARKKYQDVLLEDPLCLDAVQGQKACDTAIKKYGDERLRLTHQRAMAEAAWTLPDPIIKKNQTATTNFTDEEGINKPAVGEDNDTKEIREKLKTTRLEDVNFDGDANNSGTPLPEALRKLRDLSGVNFFLYYPNAQISAPVDTGAAPEQGLGSATAANDNGEEEDEDEDESADNSNAAAKPQVSAVSTNYPLVNLNLKNKTLEEIVKALAQNTNMKYKVEKNAVVFAPQDAPLDDMQIKVFMFDEGMLEELGGGDSPDELQKGLQLLVEAEAEKDLFPVGSKVMYDPKFRSLIVLNTPQNLNLINDALVQLRQRDPEPMVQVQVKFVEVEQSDLKELGFIQSLGRPDGTPGQPTNGRLQFDTNDTVINNSQKNTVTFSTSKNGYNYNLVINAINQMNGKDILSSPKVLTKSGEKVTIRMISERYFAWDYEEGDVDTDTEGGVTISAITPLWPEFEVQELGIEMEITPKVDKEKRLITLDVHPWVKALVGWTEYDYIDENGSSEKLTRPIISERTTDTNVVVYNEETVVIGGMIKDYTTTINDKVPLLGDIPLIGNFFKSKSTQVKKTNLLIFVTARILKPNGMPYFPSDKLGKPSSAGIGDLY